MLITTPVLWDCDAKGFFELIDICWGNASGPRRAIHRLCSLMRKMGVRRAILEPITASQDREIASELEGLRDFTADAGLQLETTRVIFLAAPLAHLEELDGVTAEQLLATAVLAKVIPTGKEPSAYVLRAKVSTPSYVCKMPCEGKDHNVRVPLLNNYYHVSKPLSLELGSREMTINGTFFCQQNGITSACAHSCLKMVVNNSPAHVGNYLTTKDINDWLVLTPGKTPGLKEGQVEVILQKCSMQIETFDFFDCPGLDLDYAQCVYHFLESRCPVLLVITTTPDEHGRIGRHVVSVLGHTLNSDLWFPEAKLSYGLSLEQQFIYSYQTSSAWVDHFIIHDDNFGMYLCLPVQPLKKRTLPQLDPGFRAFAAMGVVPCKLPTPWIEAETATVWLARKVFNVIASGNEWLDRMQKSVIVTRTFLCDPTRYAAHLSSKRDDLPRAGTYLPAEIQTIVQGLPDHFWLTEVSLPDLYSTNKTKIMDIIYSALNEPIRTGNYANKVLRAIIPGFAMDGNFITGSPHGICIPTSMMSYFPLLSVDEQTKMEW